MNNFATMPLRFRVWSEEEKRFLRYDDIYYKGCGEDERVDFDLLQMALIIDQHKESWSNFIISQDTGFKDKNGKSIYTGNIIELTKEESFNHGSRYKQTFVMPVLYRNGEVLGNMSGVCEGEFTACVLSVQDKGSIRIVGNIWQNPELLEEKA